MGMVINDCGARSRRWEGNYNCNLGTLLRIINRGREREEAIRNIITIQCFLNSCKGAF